MTQKKFIVAIRKTGATVNVRDGEYRVNIPKGKESTAYYTDDGSDALATAKIMMHRYKLFGA